MGKRPPTEAAPDIPDEHARHACSLDWEQALSLAMTLIPDANKSGLEPMIGASPPSVGGSPTLVRQYFHTFDVVGGCRFPALHGGISGISSGGAFVEVGVRWCNWFALGIRWCN